MMKLLHKLLILSIALFSFGSVSAQTASLRGVVKDKITDAALPFVKVSLKGADGLEVVSAKTDFNFGEYQLDSIPAGEYQIEFWVRGYRIKRVESFVVNSNSSYTKNMKLDEEFSRFSTHKAQAFLEPKYYDENHINQYLMYSGLTMIVLAAFALR
jgi:hypothetical protein